MPETPAPTMRTSTWLLMSPMMPAIGELLCGIVHNVVAHGCAECTRMGTALAGGGEPDQDGRVADPRRAGRALRRGRQGGVRRVAACRRRRPGAGRGGQTAEPGEPEAVGRGERAR